MSFCPECGEEMERVADYPDTGTSVDFWDEKCKNGHRFVVERENQTGEKKLTAIEDVDEGEEEEEEVDEDDVEEYRIAAWIWNK